MTTGGIKDNVDSAIRTYRLLVFSRAGCPVCLGARNIARKYIGQVLKANEVCFVDVDAVGDPRAMRNYLKLLTGNSVV